MSDGWTKFSPSWTEPEMSGPRLAALAFILVGAENNDDRVAAGATIDEVGAEFFKGLRNQSNNEEVAKLEAAGSILIDLARQRWPIAVDAGTVLISRPTGGLDAVQEKDRVRAQEGIKREEQLNASSVRRFIATMESSRLHVGRFVSVFSLMRDGEELAALLRHHEENGSLAEEFGNVVQPYVQVVSSQKDKCEFTGLPLADIWRYFRYTWTNQATSVPGRNMRFLVRDRGAPCHPIIGIGALGSPIIALRSRDQVIGWDRDAFFARAKKMALPNLLSWARSSISRILGDVYINDLIEEGLITEEDLDNPSEDLVALLRRESEEASRTHRNHTPDRRLKETATAYDDGLWETRAKTPLFRSKRCSQLANILRVRRAFAKAEELEVGVDVGALLKSSEMRWALAALVRFEKARKIGIAMADLMVCGAVPPYNALIGGKLVSALAVSPEIIQAYRRRYSESASEIASAMAGRRIVRSPDLVLFGTTSLYGVTSSQYNRLKIPCDEIGGEAGEFIRYQMVGRTASFGTSHFSERTIAALVKLTRQSLGGLRVNSIFGEGVSPKLRKIRDGLNILGLPTDELMHHERQRIVYIVPVARNYADYLMGFDEVPDLFMPMADPPAVTKKIVAWWTRRWALRRASRDSVLSEINEHTLTYPMEHGARVKMPATQQLQGVLFE